MASLEKLRAQQRRFIEAHGLDPSRLIRESFWIRNDGTFVVEEIQITADGKTKIDDSGYAVTENRTYQVKYAWAEINPPTVLAGSLSHEHVERPMRVTYRNKIYGGVIRHLTVGLNDVRLLITTPDGEVIAGSLKLKPSHEIEFPENAK